MSPDGNQADLERQANLGNRLKELRHERGISQEDFARSIGMHHTYYSTIEAGKQNVTLRNLARLAYGFDMTMSELLKGVEGLGRAQGPSV